MSDLERKQLAFINIQYSPAGIKVTKKVFLQHIQSNVQSFTELQSAQGFYTWLSDHPLLWGLPKQAEANYTKHFFDRHRIVDKIAVALAFGALLAGLAYFF